MQSGYATWAKHHELAVEASKARHRASLRPTPHYGTRPCKIKGCPRKAYKGDLCKGHWAMVPYSDRARLAADAMMASHAVAKKFHARFLRELQTKINAA